jgi:hypothetical protein
VGDFTRTMGPLIVAATVIVPSIVAAILIGSSNDKSMC